MGNLNLGRMSLPSFQYILFDLLISIKVFGISKFFWNQSKIVWNYWRMGKVIIKSNSELESKYICEKNINLTFLVHVFYVVAQSHFVVEDVQINSMFSVASVLSINEFITCFSRILNFLFKKIYVVSFNNRFLRERGMAFNPKMEYQVFFAFSKRNQLWSS